MLRMRESDHHETGDGFQPLCGVKLPSESKRFSKTHTE